MDLIASVERLPTPGETVASAGITRLLGGKGANQAIAAARQEVDVRFIGSVGGDAEGRAYRKRLTDEGINTKGIATERDALTGTAIIGVDANAENIIMVSPEANGLVSRESVTKHRRLIESADTFLLQFEVPNDALFAAVEIANAAGVPALLNPSPFRADFRWSELQLDTVIVNKAEATELTGLRIGSIKRQLNLWRKALIERNIRRLVITRGSKSTLHLETTGPVSETPTQTVSPIDTVGAGDAFAGCLAAGMARRDSIETAITRANCAGALATLKPGAQAAIPNRRQITAHLKGK